MTEDSEELTVRLRSGDVKALAELFAKHRDRLWRIAGFRLPDRLRTRVDPEDVLQEAYLAAARRLEHYGAEAKFSPFVWLRMIVNQTLIDTYRRHVGAKMRDLEREVHIEACRYAQATSASLAIHLVGHQTSPSQAAARAELLSQVEQAMESMDPIDREVLALRHFEELTNGEVAEVLGIQQKAASIRYVRAMRRLKTVLERVPGFFDESAHV